MASYGIGPYPEPPWLDLREPSWKPRPAEPCSRSAWAAPPLGRPAARRRPPRCRDSATRAPATSVHAVRASALF
eukprot:scaffold114319_cov75-Phaeocystis_antarctica.AAC.1